MHLSMYNRVVEHEDGTLLINLITGGLVLLKGKTKRAYELFLANDFTDETYITRFKDFGFLVEGDERAELKQQYEEAGNDPKMKYFFVMLNDICNLACPYCYQPHRSRIAMTPEIQEQVKDFFRRVLTATPTERLGLAFYGGEPMLSVEALANISRYVRTLSEEIGVKVFYQGMVTNGTRFTDEMCDLIVTDLGVRNLQITMDGGCKEDHNRTRGYPLPIIGKSSFDDIVAGLGRLIARGGQINVRLNVNKDTINRIIPLFDYFYEKGWYKKNDKGGYLFAYAAAIFDGGCHSDKSRYDVFSQKEFAQAVVAVRNWYKDHDVPFKHIYQMRFNAKACTVNRRYDFVINPDGSLTKCTHHGADPKFAIGHVTDTEFHPEKHAYHVFNPFDSEECGECAILPICLGGCRALNRVEEKDQDFEAGCMTTRYNLDQEIRHYYEVTKARSAAKP